jgi:hypothetical protein
MTPDEVAAEVRLSLLHPEFGTIYQEPDGEAYLAYQAGLTDGRAESTRKKKSMSESNEGSTKPVISTESNLVSTKPYSPPADEYRPMSKVEGGVIVGVVAAVVTAVVFGIRADIKNQEKWAEQQRVEREERDARAESVRKARTAWFDSQRKGGKTVLELRDGSYIAIDNDAYAKAEIKKKGQWI